MPDRIVTFYRAFLSRTMGIVSKLEFNSNEEEIAHIFTLLSSSIELLDNMCVLALNESKIGIPILLRTILEASVDIQFILVAKDNYKRIEVEDALLWQGIIECVYKGNKYVKDIRSNSSFGEESKGNAAKLKDLKNSGMTKADISCKFNKTIYADAYESIYAILCSYSHNGKRAQKERHITTEDIISRINMFKETSIEEHERYLLMAADFIFESVDSINEAFKYGLEDEMAELRGILSSKEI